MATREARLVAAALGVPIAIALFVRLALFGAPSFAPHPERSAPSTDLCHSDDDCADLFVCRQARFRDGGIGRACRVRGTREEGEPCRSPAQELHEACLLTLRCNYGFCGRPCGPGTSDECPTGSRCRDSGEGASCVPTCEGGACPAGTECVHIDAQFALCALLIGEDCGKRPCTPGKVCRTHYKAGRTPIVESQCVTPCASNDACQAGHFCDDGECARRCRLDRDDCPAGTFCAVAVSRNDVGRCWPE